MTEFPKRKLKILLTVFVLSGAFLFSIKINITRAAANIPNAYLKEFNGTLSSQDWNNLLGYSTSTYLVYNSDYPYANGDFLNTLLPATLIGPLGINSVPTLAQLTIQATSTNDILNLLGNSGNRLLTVLNNGNVGIGTSQNPNDIFSIAGTGGSVAPSGSDLTGHNFTSTYFPDDAFALTNVSYVKSVADAISLETASSTLWNGSKNGNIWNGDAGVGNVGIGTTNPSSKLDIIGRGGFSNGIILTGVPSSLSDVNYIQALNSDSTVGFLAGSGVFSAYSGPYFGARGNTYSAISGQRGMMFLSGGAVSSPTGKEGTISFYTSLGEGHGESIRMIIGTTGNIGIGTTLPTASLDISGLNGFKNEYSTQLTALGGAGNSVVMADNAGNLFSTTTNSFIGASLPHFVGLTADIYNGNNNGAPGYNEANSVCSTEYSGSHVCASYELLNSIASGGNLPNEDAWVFVGPPAYTASANDCEGRTSIKSTSRGAYWQKPNTEYPQGRGLLSLCNISLKFACCN